MIRLGKKGQNLSGTLNNLACTSSTIIRVFCTIFYNYSKLCSWSVIKDRKLDYAEFNSSTTKVIQMEVALSTF